MSTVQHKNIPDNQLHEIKGAATASLGQIPVATGLGTAIFATPPYTSFKMGFWDYADTATSSTPLALSVANTYYQLTNNGLGVDTNTTYALPGIPNIFNTATNYFNFASLKLGDTVDIRIELEIVTTAANNVLSLEMELGVGSAPYRVPVRQYYIKAAGTYKLVGVLPLYMGNTLTRNNPARLMIVNDTTGSTIKVVGWYTRVLTNG
jgi:hypothetical protein